MREKRTEETETMSQEQHRGLFVGFVGAGLLLVWLWIKL